MSLWDLLTLICFVAPIAGANFVAKQNGQGTSGHVFAVLFGIALGALFSGAMRFSGEKLLQYIRASSARGERILGVLYCAAVAWAFVGLAVSTWMYTVVFIRASR